MKDGPERAATRGPGEIETERKPILEAASVRAPNLLRCSVQVLISRATGIG